MIISSRCGNKGRNALLPDKIQTSPRSLMSLQLTPPNSIL